MILAARESGDPVTIATNYVRDNAASFGIAPSDADHLLVTKETTRFDPGVVEYKYYAAGIGFIRGEVVKGGDEQTELVNITVGNCSP